MNNNTFVRFKNPVQSNDDYHKLRLFYGKRILETRYFLWRLLINFVPSVLIPLGCHSKISAHQKLNYFLQMDSENSLSMTTSESTNRSSLLEKYRQGVTPTSDLTTQTANKLSHSSALFLNVLLKTAPHLQALFDNFNSNVE